MRRLLIYGDQLQDIAFELTLLLGLSLAILVLGVFLYQRLRLRQG